MKQARHVMTGLRLIADLIRALWVHFKRLIRFLIWQWRARQTSSVIRSFYVSLHAKVGERVILENGVFLDSTSSVGNYTYVNQHSSIEDAEIGQFCSIARGVMIGPADHDYSKISTHPFWYQPFYGFDVLRMEPHNLVPKKTRISDDVWIGCNVVIRRGVLIQTGAVIGAGSVVTKDVGPYEIWGGVPARKLKQRFSGDVIEKMLKLSWCSFSKDKINSEVVPNIDEVEYIVNNVTNLPTVDKKSDIRPGPTH